MFCELPDADRQRYTEKFESLFDRCSYEIPRTEWTDD